ncbi:MAG: permease, partial [Chthoniobacterales bacterium]|nr:permease [Chthoniobacterales bacterium]
TNLVIELGAVLWLLMGWRFVLAEVTGAFFLVAIMWLLVRLFVPKSLENEARAQANKSTGHSCHEHDHDGHQPETLQQLASAFVMDWQMLWKGNYHRLPHRRFAGGFCPTTWWQALFLENGPAPVRLIENAIVGPIIAVGSFVCSVGNLPLASLLWSHGISFGGVISFIYADLIVVPLLVIYFKYYGARAATAITLILFTSMVLAGIIVDLIFSALDLVPTGPRPPSAMRHAMITWNYTSWLDVLAAVALTVLLVVHFRGGKQEAPCH